MAKREHLILETILAYHKMKTSLVRSVHNHIEVCILEVKNQSPESREGIRAARVTIVNFWYFTNLFRRLRS